MPHDFHNKNTAVRGSGGVDAVKNVGGDFDGRMEAEGHIGPPNIVVNGLGKRNNGNSLFAEKIGRLLGSVSSQNHKAVELHFLEVLFHSLNLVHVVLTDDAHFFKRLARGTEDGAAQRQNAGKIFLLHTAVASLD